LKKLRRFDYLAGKWFGGGMKTLLSTLIFSILGLNIIFAQEKLNLDDPKDQDQFIATAVKKLDWRKKADKTFLHYLPYSQVPYSGRHVEFYDNGQLKFANVLKDGRNEGLCVSWYLSGQKRSEINFKDGKKDGFENAWWENGQKKMERNVKDNKLVSLTRWKPNGEKCPITNIVDGNGVSVYYNDDGTELFRNTWKDGEIVVD